MKHPNAQVMRLLLDTYPRSLTANQIVCQTQLSFTTVRNSLNLAYDQGEVERDLDLGLNGHPIHRWWYCGVAIEQA